MRGSLRIATVRGIPIRIHWSFLLVLPILAFAFGRSARYAAHAAGLPEGALTGNVWIWGVGMALALFLSVLLHELAHALYGRRTGAQVKQITLLMIGGVSQMTEMPRRSRDEAVMALLGPLTSLVLGAILVAVSVALRGTTNYDLRFAFVYVGELNLVLGIFNLIPAFPMDGGRILRAALAGRLGVTRSTRVAATLGKAFAVLFGIWGLLTGNILLVLIAAFIWMGAAGEAQQTEVKAALEGVRVREVMRPFPRAVTAEAPLDAITAEMQRERMLSVPVVEGERLVGVVSLDDLRAVGEERRFAARAGELAHETPPIGPEEPAWRAVQLLAESRLPMLPVVQEGRLVGTLTPDEIERAVRLRIARTRRAFRREAHA